MTYLADTSAVVRFRRGRDLAPRWIDAVTAGEVAVCPAVEAELTRSAAGGVDREHLRTELRLLFGWTPMPDDAWRFVARAQDALVAIGHHRGPSVVDLLVASAAEVAGLTVLHVDADFDAISRVTGVSVRRADRP